MTIEAKLGRAEGFIGVERSGPAALRADDHAKHGAAGGEQVSLRAVEQRQAAELQAMEETVLSHRSQLKLTTKALHREHGALLQVCCHWRGSRAAIVGHSRACCVWALRGRPNGGTRLGCSDLKTPFKRLV